MNEDFHFPQTIRSIINSTHSARNLDHLFKIADHGFRCLFVLLFFRKGLSKNLYLMKQQAMLVLATPRVFKQSVDDHFLAVWFLILTL